MLSTDAGPGPGREARSFGRTVQAPPHGEGPRWGAERSGRKEAAQAGKPGGARPGSESAPPLAAGGMRPARRLSARDGPRGGGLRRRRAAAAEPGRGAAGPRPAGPRRAAGRRARPGPRPLAGLPRRPPASAAPGGSAARQRGCRSSGRGPPRPAPGPGLCVHLSVIQGAPGSPSAPGGGWRQWFQREAAE